MQPVTVSSELLISLESNMQPWVSEVPRAMGGDCQTSGFRFPRHTISAKLVKMREGARDRRTQ